MKRFLLALLAPIMLLASCANGSGESVVKEESCCEETLEGSCWGDCMYNYCFKEFGESVEDCADVFKSGSVKDIVACLKVVLTDSDPVVVAAKVAGYSIACGAKCIFDAEETEQLHRDVQELCDEYGIAFPVQE